MPATVTAGRRPTIDSEADLRAGVGHLVAHCPRLAAVYELTGLPPLRRETPGFASLVDIIVSQLVSLAAADAISMRLRTVVTTLDPAGVLTAGEARIRSAGLTGAKTRSVLALADAIVGGQLDFDRLAQLDDELARAELLAYRGVGPWTADIYVMFCLGRRDAFAPGDLALRTAMSALFQLPDRPSIAETERIAERWRPWRGVAARLLWAYYRTLKSPR